MAHQHLRKLNLIQVYRIGIMQIEFDFCTWNWVYESIRYIVNQFYDDESIRYIDESIRYIVIDESIRYIVNQFSIGGPSCKQTKQFFSH